MEKEVIDQSLPDEHELVKTPEKELVNNIYHTLTRREIRREYPPAEKEIKEAISRSLENNVPIELVIVWGGFKNTEKGRADEADEMALNSIQETVDKIKELGVDAKFTIYFGDFHAFSPYYGRGASFIENSRKYYDDMERLAKENGCGEFLRVSESIYGLHPKDLEDELLTPDIEPKLCYTHDAKTQKMFLDYGQSFWENASSEIKKEIMQSAEKYASRELIEKEGLEKIALLYAGSRLYEEEWLENIHKDGIFSSYGRPIYKLQPKKTIFNYSIPKGMGQPPKSEPPWLRDNEKKLEK